MGEISDLEPRFTLSRREAASDYSLGPRPQVCEHQHPISREAAQARRLDRQQWQRYENRESTAACR